MPEAIRQGDIPGVQLRCRQPLTLSPAELWPWLTEADRLARWIAPRVAVEAADPDPRGGRRPERGPTLLLAGEDETGAPRTERARGVEIDPPRRWVLSFERLDAGWTAATRLTLELTPQGTGCELSLLQDGFQNLPLSIGMTVWERYRRRWREALTRLAAVTGQIAEAPH